MQVVPLSQLTPGMISAQDILSTDKRFILKKGTQLTDEIITRLAIHGVLSVVVDKTAVPSSPVSHDTKENYIRNHPDFQVFKQLYTIEVNSLKDNLNAVITRNAPLDIGNLLNNAMNIIENATGRLSIFDMLHNMHEFDDSTYSHCLNVGLISHLFAVWMKMSPEEINLATACGLLHDLGKLLVDPAIIRKPSSLTDSEFAEIKKHPLSGYYLLKERHADDIICNVALMHHERCDGSGYPSGLKESEIDDFAMLVAIADVYDAMTSTRVYRGPLCPFAVIESFEENGYQKYGTKFLLPFLENIANTYLTSHCRLSDGRTGTIVFINKLKLSRPMVKCGEEYINLAERTDLRIDVML